MDLSELHFFNPYAETAKTRNNLPHWQQKGAVYFVTFRLADAIPQSLLGPWQELREAWLLHHPIHGQRKSNVNITSAFPTQWNDGWTPDMVPVYCANQSVGKSWRVCSSISMENDFTIFHGW